MTHMKHNEIKCSQCDVCGKQVEAEFMCTFVLNEDHNKETACWCVCQDCKPVIVEKVHEAFKPLVEEEEQRASGKK